MEKAIKLQGISGQQTGTQAKNLKIGDIIVWNYGYKSEVVEITPSKTGKTITFALRSFQDGEIRTRKMGSEKLVVIDKKPENKVNKAIRCRKQTHYGIYSDIGIVLDKFTTAELVDYYTNTLKNESDLRYYIEQQIILGEINKIKYENDIK